MNIKKNYVFERIIFLFCYAIIYLTLKKKELKLPHGRLKDLKTKCSGKIKKSENKILGNIGDKRIELLRRTSRKLHKKVTIDYKCLVVFLRENYINKVS